MQSREKHLHRAGLANKFSSSMYAILAPKKDFLMLKGHKGRKFVARFSLKKLTDLKTNFTKDSDSFKNSCWLLMYKI